MRALRRGGARQLAQLARAAVAEAAQPSTSQVAPTAVLLPPLLLPTGACGALVLIGNVPWHAAARAGLTGVQSVAAAAGGRREVFCLRGRKPPDAGGEMLLLLCCC